jgi:heterodisulfide reductase subunit A
MTTDQRELEQFLAEIMRQTPNLEDVAGDYIEDQIRKSLADSIRKSFAATNFGDVMVVGGGVSGVQASLDLAASGFLISTFAPGTS